MKKFNKVDLTYFHTGSFLYDTKPGLHEVAWVVKVVLEDPNDKERKFCGFVSWVLCLTSRPSMNQVSLYTQLSWYKLV